MIKQCLNPRSGGVFAGSQLVACRSKASRAEKVNSGSEVTVAFAATSLGMMRQSAPLHGSHLLSRRPQTACMSEIMRIMWQFGAATMLLAILLGAIPNASMGYLSQTTRSPVVHVQSAGQVQAPITHQHAPGTHETVAVVARAEGAGLGRTQSSGSNWIPTSEFTARAHKLAVPVQPPRVLG